MILSKRSAALPQVRTQLAGSFYALFFAPLGNSAVIAAEKHIRNLHPSKILRARIMRILQQSAAEGFISGRAFIAQRPLQQAHNGINQRQGRNLSAGQNVVADGNRLGSKTQTDPLVESS